MDLDGTVTLTDSDPNADEHRRNSILRWDGDLRYPFNAIERLCRTYDSCKQALEADGRSHLSEAGLNQTCFSIEVASGTLSLSEDKGLWHKRSEISYLWQTYVVASISETDEVVSILRKVIHKLQCLPCPFSYEEDRADIVADGERIRLDELKSTAATLESVVRLGEEAEKYRDARRKRPEWDDSAEDPL